MWVHCWTDWLDVWLILTPVCLRAAHLSRSHPRKGSHPERSEGSEKQLASATPALVAISTRFAVGARVHLVSKNRPFMVWRIPSAAKAAWGRLFTARLERPFKSDLEAHFRNKRLSSKPDCHLLSCHEMRSGRGRLLARHSTANRLNLNSILLRQLNNHPQRLA